LTGGVLSAGHFWKQSYSKFSEDKKEKMPLALRDGEKDSAKAHFPFGMAKTLLYSSFNYKKNPLFCPEGVNAIGESSTLATI
jgi:hypothetical protein